MSEKRRCSQTTVKGKPCKAYAMAGSDRCAVHLKIAGVSTKLTPEIQRHIVQLVQAGNYTPVACRAAGIGESTFYDWWARGDPAKDDPADAIYRAFRADVEDARATGETVLVSIVAREARNADVKAAIWLLERMHPERWARASQREGGILNAPAAQEAAAQFDPFREFDELAEARRKKLGGGDGDA